MIRVVYLEWLDSSRQGTSVWMELPPKEGYGVCLCKSLGFITHEDKHTITVASHLDSQSVHMSGHLTIPKAAIIKRRKMKLP